MNGGLESWSGCVAGDSLHLNHSQGLCLDEGACRGSPHWTISCDIHEHSRTSEFVLRTCELKDPGFAFTQAQGINSAHFHIHILFSLK